MSDDAFSEPYWPGAETVTRAELGVEMALCIAMVLSWPHTDKHVIGVRLSLVDAGQVLEEIHIALMLHRPQGVAESVLQPSLVVPQLLVGVLRE